MIGIVILNYNTYELTLECVKSIVERTKSNYKIYIVDNASIDDSAVKLISYFYEVDNIFVIKSKVNGGYSKGNNIGVRKAMNDGADYIAIINSDIKLLNNTIDILYNQISAYENICAVGPSIYDLDNRAQHFARNKLDLKGFLFDKKPLYWFKKLMPSVVNSKRLISWENEDSAFSFYGMLSGCCFLIKSDILKKIGLFDENVFLFHEEDILAYKLEKEKKKVAIVFEGRVRHAESSSVGKSGSAFLRYHRIISAIYVLRAYARLGNFKMLISILLTVSPFVIYSIFNSSYRKKLNGLFKKLKLILIIYPKDFKEDI
jgi:GT2 family glycosyltransferase